MGVKTLVGVRPAASLYAVVRSAWAWAAAASAAWSVPLIIPGGNPVTAVPGLSPRSAPTVVPPVLVTVEAPRTAKLPAVPRATEAAAIAGGGGAMVPVGIVMVLESTVTAAVWANTRPSTAAPVVTVTEAKARMLPLKTVVVPRVAELPTSQKTLAAWAPLIRST